MIYKSLEGKEKARVEWPRKLRGKEFFKKGRQGEDREVQKKILIFYPQQAMDTGNRILMLEKFGKKGRRREEESQEL